MRILLVEDEKKVGDFVKSGLEQAQHGVDVARNLADGDFMASVNDYDLLIFDCLLPDGDGRQLCRDLRAQGKTTPILFFTAMARRQTAALQSRRAQTIFWSNPTIYSACRE